MVPVATSLLRPAPLDPRGSANRFTGEPIGTFSPSKSIPASSIKMNKKAKQRIDAMIAAGVSPARLKGSEGQALKLGRSTIKLIGNGGEATTAGK